MDSILFGVSSVMIALLLLVAMLVANHLGFKLGNRWASDSSPGLKAQTNAIQAAMLGLLALLLGFSFSMALGRYDARTQAVVDEGHAIAGAMMRSDLLPTEHQAAARSQLRNYLDLRIAMGGVDLTARDQREIELERLAAEQQQLWRQAVELATGPGGSAYLGAVGAVLDAFARRDAELHRHVPVVVLLLLFTVFVIAGALLGYSGGLEQRRPLGPTLAMTVLMVLVIFIIIDLDRPRRGIIQVDQSTLQVLAQRLDRHDQQP